MADNIEAGIHHFTGKKDYIPPENPNVSKHLEWFMGLKLGFMMHWSPATQLGLTESWPLSDGDADWSQYEIDWTDDMNKFRAQYWALNKTFNPIRFQPKKIAKVAKESGFKYVLFTTKHHDGFCMFDTKQTDYKITAPDCPFSTHEYANITKALFDAFRAEDMAVSAYFSKPDWHCDFYWHRAFGTAKSRNMNNNIKEHPELWEKFVQFTHRQIEEITSDYGKVDVLWLDGGQVAPRNEGQDIRLGEVVEKIRSSTQPHLIVCDRTVGGKYENIVTPEQTIPSKPLNIPWESCVTLGKNFSFHYDDEYKSAFEIVHILLDIVSKGGSLALNVTLRPDGAVPNQALAMLSKLGQWLSIHGEGIYNSTSAHIEPHHTGILYTKVDERIYAFFKYMEIPHLPKKIYLCNSPSVESVRLIRTNQLLPFVRNGDWIIVDTSDVSMVGAELAEGFVMC